MKPFMLRVFLSFTAVVFASFLLGTAGMLGRGSMSPIAAVQINERAPDLVSYMLVDVDRRTTTARRLPVPELVDERWYAQPPLTLQRVTRGEFADWTLSAVDVRRNTISPVMRLRTSDNVRIRIPDFLTRELPDGAAQYTVYVPHSGEIWTATPDQPDAVLVATAARGLLYPLSLSPDGTRLAVNGAGELLVMNSDGSDARTFDGLQTQAWVTWSPDAQKLLASPIDLYSRESARAINVQTGEETVMDGARLAISCGTGYVAITEQANGFGITHISEDGESSAILDAETLNGLEPAGIFQLEEHSCEWLVIMNRRGESILVQTSSGDTIALGNGFPVIRMDGGRMVYHVQAGNMIEVRRLALNSGAEPELLWAYPRIIEEILWLDDAVDRGLFIDSGQLNLIERSGQFTIPLNGALAESYSLLDD
jgi:hypothetical protein